MITVKNIFLILLTAILLASCGAGKNTAGKNKNDSNANVLNPSETGISDKSKSDIQQEALFVEACRLRMLGETDQSLALFNQCLVQSPQNDAALYEVASVYFDKKDYNKALQYIAPAIKLNPTNKWYKIMGADVYESLGKYKEAADLFNQLCAQFPDETDYQADRAYFLSKAGEYEKAIDAYNIIQNKNGISEDLAIEKQKLWLKLNKTDKAINEITALRNAYPDEPRYLAMLADIYVSNNMNDKAFETIQQLAKLDSTNIQAQLAVADYYYKNGDFEKSFQYQKKVFANPAANIDKKVQVLLSYLPYLSLNEKRKEDALMLGELMVNAHPTEAKAFAVYGDLLNQSDKSKEALAAYQKAVSLDEGKFAIWEQILFLESKLEMKDSLLKTSGKVMELFPDQALAYYYSGIAKAQAKNFTEAIKDYNRVLAMGSEDKGLLSQVYASLGDCYHSLNYDNASDSCYEQSISFDPSNVYALNNYAYYLSTRGEKLDIAEKMSAKVVNVLAPNIPNYIDTYAWVLYKMKNYPEAKVWMQKIINTNINSNYFDHYGDILFQSGEIDNAIIYWMKAKDAGGDKEKLDKKINDRKVYE